MQSIVVSGFVVYFCTCIGFLMLWAELIHLCGGKKKHFVWSVQRFLPSPTLSFPLFISVMGTFFTLGAHGWFVRFCQTLVQSPSLSWLSIVEAPGCLRHPTFT